MIGQELIHAVELTFAVTSVLAIGAFFRGVVQGFRGK